MSEVGDKEYEELLDLFRENNLTKYGIDRLYGAIIDRKIKSGLEIERLNKGLTELDNMFYETFRISQNGYYSISEWELKEFTDKIKELKGSNENVR